MHSTTPTMLRPVTLTLGVAGFGQLTSMQGGGIDSAGPRQLQLTGRITF